jgi:lysophospholipase L1-like esterase
VNSSERKKCDPAVTFVCDLGYYPFWRVWMRFNIRHLRAHPLALVVILASSHVAPLSAVGPERSPTSAVCHVPDTVAWSGNFAASLQRALTLEPEVRIVVLGSSSTAGTGASSAQTSFVEQFQRALGAQSHRRVHVFNAGVRGDTTADMLRRLRKDVIDRKPALVIWQTGVNDALRRVPIDRFSRELAQGIAEMKSRGVPVILLDQQDFIGAEKTPDYYAYVNVIQGIAQQKQVTLLQRYRVMRYLSERRDGGLRSLLGRDGLHMNDFAHRCIGELLAANIGRLLG